MSKLETLMANEGFEGDLEGFMEACEDSVVPGICMNPGCDYTTGVEPDQDQGWCEICGTNTVKSGAELLLEEGLG